MNSYSLMNFLLLCGASFFAGTTLLLFWEQLRQKKLLLQALEKNKQLFDTQFVNNEVQLKKFFGEELSKKLSSKIEETISSEKGSYKELCAAFINHHSEAMELLPSKINQIISAYLDCAAQGIILIKEKASNEVKKKEEDAFRFQASIEQADSEKQLYLDKYHEALNLLNSIYLRYKATLDIEQVESLDNLNLEEIAKLFKIAENDSES